MSEPTNTPPTAELQEDKRKLVVTIPEALLAALRSTCAAKAEVSLLGRIQGKHPGLNALTAWARDTLHPTLALLSLKANNLFEVTFTSAEGRIHALTQTELTCETATIAFSSWRPHYDSKTPQEADRLDFPIWVQIVDLCQVLRDETFLKTIGEQIGQVIAIDNSEAYRAKLFGPRIRILVKDLNTLPHTVVLPRLDGEGVVEYTLEYSGLPNQCGRCRSREHQVRNCPRKENKSRKRDCPTPTPATADEHEQQPSLPPEPESPVMQPEERSPQLPSPVMQPEERSPQPPSYTANTGTTSELKDNIEAALTPDEVNFPHLPTSATKMTSPTPQSPSPSTPPTRTPFVWCAKPPPDEQQQQDRGKGKAKPQTNKTSESTPITRQGYRTGRLAEDFWTAIAMPNTPQVNRKKLRVIPILTKSPEQKEYLVDRKQRSFSPIAISHIAELLAGIPWTPNRAKQHIVNELSQALHKILIFGNNAYNPIQRWSQGQWYAEWTTTADGEHNCTLYVIIMVNEIKIRKGKNLEWRRTPTDFREKICGQNSEGIQEITADGSQWKAMIGSTEIGIFTPPQFSSEVSPNPFSILSEEETSLQTSQ